MGCIHTPNPYSSPCGNCRAADLESKLATARDLLKEHQSEASRLRSELQAAKALALFAEIFGDARVAETFRKTFKEQPAEIERLRSERDEAREEAAAHNAAATQYEADIASLRAEVATWRKVTGFDDAEQLDFFLGRNGVKNHLDVLGKLSSDAWNEVARLKSLRMTLEAELNAAVASAEKAELAFAAIDRAWTQRARELRELVRIDVLRAVAIGAHVAHSERNLGPSLTAAIRWIESKALLALEELGQEDAQRLIAEREEYEHG